MLQKIYRLKNTKMGRIYDYNAFADNKKGGNGNEYSFGCEIKYVDIDVFGKPEEYEELSNCKAFIEYSVDLIIKRAGIDSLMFKVNSIEFEFEVDDYPNGTKEFDIDLIPGKTVDYSQIKTEVHDSSVPTYPDKLEINMNKSTDPKNFDITVYFGNDVKYR
jgi:hypothetical protein